MIITHVNNNSKVEERVVNDYAKCIESAINNVDFSSFRIADVALFIVINMDEDSLRMASNIDDTLGKRFIHFQNIPAEYGYNTKFEAKLSSLRVKVQFSDIPFINDIENIVFVFDFKTGIDSRTKEGAEKISTIKDGKVLKENDPEITQRKSTFVPSIPKYNLDKVIMSEQMKEEIEDALSIIRNRKRIYDDWGYGEIDPQPKAILSFWGPPGTGKTMCAHGIASEMKQKILAVNYAEIESKYAGESPKNLIAAFNAAQENNAVLFFDEADSFLGKRITNVQSGHDQSINSLRSQMLILLEEFEGIVIFATNLVKNFDPAFQTRILRHIEFDLPNEQARMHIFKSQIPLRAPIDFILSDDSLKALSDASEGFSGRDIRNTVLDTLSSAAKKNLNSISLNDFLTTIKTRQESYERLKEERLKDNKKVAEDIKNSIIEKSIQDLNAALVSVALYAVWSDEKVTDAESSIVTEYARTLNVNLPNGIDIQYLEPLPHVVEYFNTREKKEQALDIAIRIAVADGELDIKESEFIKKLLTLLELKNVEEGSIMLYAETLAKANYLWNKSFHFEVS